MQGSLVDYDLDNDGLISVTNQVQLAAITLDLDGDGAPDNGDDADEYSEAFPSAVADMGCPEDTGCAGYELDGNVTLSGRWRPIGANGAGFAGTFEGNGNTISGLYIEDAIILEKKSNFVALFARLEADGIIRNVGVVRPNVSYSGGRLEKGSSSGRYMWEGW